MQQYERELREKESRLVFLNEQTASLMAAQSELESEASRYKRQLIDYHSVQSELVSLKQALAASEAKADSLRNENSQLLSRLDRVSKQAGGLDSMLGSAVPSRGSYGDSHDPYRPSPAPREAAPTSYDRTRSGVGSSGVKSLSSLLGGGSTTSMTTSYDHRPDAFASQGKGYPLEETRDPHYPTKNPVPMGSRQTEGFYPPSSASVNPSRKPPGAPFATEQNRMELDSFDALERQLTSHMSERNSLSDEIDR